jgi:hypothetical protein
MGTAAEDAEVRNLNRRLNRANSDFVNRHAARGNFVWEMPVGGRSGLGSSWHPVVKTLLGRWSIGGIFQWNTGVFTTPRILTASFNGRPDVVAGVSWRLSDADRQRLAQQTGDSSYLDRSLRWFNPFAFKAVDTAAGRIGNAGRNVIVGPSFFNFDSVLSKRFHLPRLPERALGTIRIESFNVFNHVNFNARSLNGDVTSASVGAFSQIRGNPRQFQFGIRVEF